jgi:hypothetical protein
MKQLFFLFIILTPIYLHQSLQAMHLSQVDQQLLSALQDSPINSSLVKDALDAGADANLCDYTKRLPCI